MDRKLDQSCTHDRKLLADDYRLENTFGDLYDFVSSVFNEGTSNVRITLSVCCFINVP